MASIVSTVHGYCIAESQEDIDRYLNRMTSYCTGINNHKALITKLWHRSTVQTCFC
ncbi:hypothetical protein [Candidatus Bathycorpusculum sp.]|uniref:hypothetical protein n=1 Tax=Candidatus Bathycorpusculum sp. TaxID=2994959 RepID=UPI00281B0108|nr:hypothetical protein [Candidatus Termitimicrobium sp.]MCL2432353.1 hypothetical protein [Candidatus Termitimicrobium sp.]